jgi:nucleotide-binding universal stress UspA family protein
MYKKILVPLDGTRNDEIVLGHVQRLAKETGAVLILIQLHRIVKDDDPFMRSVQMEAGSRGYEAREKAEAQLKGLEASLRKEGIEVSTEFLVVEEPEADEIVKFAEERGCDLIALTNRERTGLGRWFFSGIEEKVKRRSSLPVLLVAKRQG